jgi:hypothetical protein
MAWLRAGLIATVVTAIVIMMALVLLSVARKGIDPMSLLLMIAFGLPIGLIAAAPVCLVALPVADAILDRSGARLFRDMAIVGACAGALVPLIVIFGFKLRPPGMIPTITGLLVLAGLVGGAAAGLFYAELLARGDRAA